MITSKIRKLGKYFSKRMVSVSFLLVGVAGILTLLVFGRFKTVTVEADGKSISVTTSAESVYTLLSQEGIVLAPGDEVTPLRLKNGVTVSVKRAFPVKIFLGNDSFVVNTTPKTLGEMFEEQGIVIGEHDIVSPTSDTVLTPETEVRVIRIQITEEQVTEIIPYEMEFSANPDMPRNASKVITKGEEGLKEAVYRVTCSNGKETGRELVSENIVRMPVTEVVEFGADTAKVTSNATAETISVIASCEYIDCKAYSYIIHGRTATGMGTKWGLIAVDPKIIPLGTRVYVQSLDGKPDYGYAIAADTGGAIKGNTIDMWVPTYAEAAQNGVRRMRVYILPQ